MSINVIDFSMDSYIDISYPLLLLHLIGFSSGTAAQGIMMATTPMPLLPRVDGVATTDGPVTKKKKLHHDDNLINVQVGMVSHENHLTNECRVSRQPSQSHVRTATSSSWNNPLSMPTAYRNRIESLPPTLSGITDAVGILKASRNHDLGGDAASPTSVSLISFPTESVYMLACCVKTASSRSIRRLLWRTDSHTSLISSCSSGEAQQEKSTVHQGSSHHNMLKKDIHPPNASLDWMMKRCGITQDAPILFVLDGYHALNFCHFNKPKTFAIRPPVPALQTTPNVVNNVTALTPTAPAPATPIKAMTTIHNEINEICSTPIHLYGEPATASPNNNRRLRAANFSDSREAFLRLASKFWPGPVVIYVRVRTLGREEDVIIPPSSPMSSISGMSVIEDDLGETVSILPESILLPASVLLQRSNGVDDVIDNNDRVEREKYFIGMSCPSHPLARKVLNETYRVGGGGGENSISDSQPLLSRLTSSMRSVTPSSKVFHLSESADTLVSFSSVDEGDRTLIRGNSRPPTRSGVAVIGRVVPAPPPSDEVANLKGSTSLLSSSNTTLACVKTGGSTTSNDVAKVMSSAIGKDNDEGGGCIYVVDGEDTRESFSVPTCQYGEIHPVSLVVDGDNRTIHVIHRRSSVNVPLKGSAVATDEGPLVVSNATVRRALLNPASFRSLDVSTEKMVDNNDTIDRVIRAVLSRWTVV